MVSIPTSAATAKWIGTMPDKRGAEMPTIKRCPVCGIENEEIELAVHLMSSENWPYEKAMDWIRQQEESCPYH